MHSFLIVGGGEKEKKISELAKKLKAKIFPFELKKIADIKNLSSFTKLSLTEKTAVLISDFDLASEETQNAFLKSLEEPQANLIYILTATSIDNCLSTIISRCEVVEIGGEEKRKDTSIFFNEFISMSLGRKFEEISKIKTREEAAEFITDIINGGHSQLVSGGASLKIIESATSTLTNLKANGNVALQLTNFVVNIED
ncbi:MAG TPA: hypothetical protein VF185_03355 [Patescibacteria group bacterium]